VASDTLSSAFVSGLWFLVRSSGTCAPSPPHSSSRGGRRTAWRREQNEKWRRPLFRNLTPERVSELRAFAEQREAQEAAGAGVDSSGVKTAYVQQQQAERAERRERRDREKREAGTR